VTIILLIIINLLVIFIPSMKDIFGVVGMACTILLQRPEALWFTLSNKGPEQLFS
jgi:sodium-coupled neutral amino acid transporter 1